MWTTEYNCRCHEVSGGSYLCKLKTYITINIKTRYETKTYAGTPEWA